jgi:hypothetical protein
MWFFALNSSFDTLEFKQQPRTQFHADSPAVRANRLDYVLDTASLAEYA